MIGRAPGFGPVPWPYLRDDEDDDDLPLPIAGFGFHFGNVGRTLIGTAFDDVLIGRFGDDTIFGRGGDDLIFGGFGDDEVRGGRGDDHIFGGFGDDDLRGNRGDDLIFGGFGDDEARGGRGDDHIFGGFGDDDLRGNGGDDRLVGGFGDDTIKGGAGADTAVVSGTFDQFAFDPLSGLLTDLRGGNPEGTDQLADVEFIEFDDRTISTDTFTLQLLHASDLEGGVDAIANAPNFAAIVDTLEDEFANTIIVSAGDNYIPGPFFNAAQQIDGQVFNDVYNQLFADDLGSDELTRLAADRGRVDITIMNVIGFDASAIGNHEFDNGSDIFESIIEESLDDNTVPGLFGESLADIEWLGAQFPYLSANLDFSADGSLGNLFTADILPNSEFVTPPSSLLDGTANPFKIAPATTVERDGELIGIVGATTQLVNAISSPTGTVDVTGGAEDMDALAAVLQPVIDDLMDGDDDIAGNGDDINKIILTSHLQQITLEETLAPKLSGVDIIIAGGSDTLLADGQDRLRAGDTADGPFPILATNADGDHVAIVSTDGEYSYVGRLAVTFDAQGKLLPASIDENVSGAFATDEQGVLDVTGEATLADAIANSEKAALVDTLVGEVTDVITAKDGDVFGETEVFIDGRRASVRTEETNMGNLTAEANLAAARDFDGTVTVSLKNGGGIRAPIGEIDGITGELLPTSANPVSGKEPGQISQLDIENSLRFNNGLTLQTVTAEQLKIIVEHAVAATAPGATPGQFPQIGGMRFSFDATQQAQVLQLDGGGDPTGNVLTEGQRVESLVVLNEFGDVADVIVENGELVGDAARPIRMVTLDFLANGGDGYPFAAFEAADPVFADRVDLEDVLAAPGEADFAPAGSEQDALAEFLAANHPVDDVNDFRAAEQEPENDLRIQNLAFRADTVVNGPKTVMEIQGAGHRSPFEGGLVTTTGIVTATDSDGFYIQDTTGDGDIATSDGIFVLNFGGQPTVGDEVTVTGTVQELQFGSDLSVTRLTTTTPAAGWTVNSSGNALPAAVVLGVDRSAPTAVIDDDGLTSFDPATDAIDFYESLEGMRIEVNDPLVVAGTNRFDEVGLVANRGAEVGVGNPVKNAVVSAGDFNPEVLLTDDDLATEPVAKTGDGFATNPVGVLDYTFGAFKLQLTSTPNVVDGGRTPDVTTLAGVGTDMTVATYNVFNLDPNDATQAANIAQTIVTNLNAPDVIALQEIQDNSGETDDGTVDADLTLDLLIDAISAAGGPTYAFGQINPVDNADGGAPGSNIRNAFLYDPTRVSLDALSRIEDPAFALNGDGSPEQHEFDGTRKPLVGEFTFLPTGDTVTVIGNHFKSKRGDDGLFGEDQPPEEITLIQRVAQAEVVNGFVEDLLAADPAARVVVLGDMNDFQFSDTLDTLANGGDATAELTNLIDGVPAEEQYSFIFNGNSQVLDHILVSDSLASGAQADMVHANLDFGFPFNNASDHDPVLAQLDLSPIA